MNSREKRWFIRKTYPLRSVSTAMFAPISAHHDGSIDPHTLEHLGPLRVMAGLYISHAGRDSYIDADSELTQQYRDEIVLAPIDPQISGSQLLYGLRYLQHARRHGEVATLHEQVGYWLYEPATAQVTLSLNTPRAQVALASGHWSVGSASFTVRAEREIACSSFVSSRFLDDNFRTVCFEMTVTIIDDHSWQYVQETHVELSGRSNLVRLRNEATLVRVSLPTANASAQLP